MEFLTELWQPILLAAVFVFVASSIIHVALPFHKADCKKLPGEDALLAAMRDQGVAPGQYVFPMPASMKEMSSPEMVAKYKQGPVGFLTVVPSGAPGMGKNLVQWFCFSLLIGVFVAYLTWHALGPGADYLQVFRIAGVGAILGYAAGNVPNAIWKGEGWGVTLKFVVDGVIYGLLTAGTFGWLWPRAI